MGKRRNPSSSYVDPFAKPIDFSNGLPDRPLTGAEQYALDEAYCSRRIWTFDGYTLAVWKIMLPLIAAWCLVRWLGA